MTTQLFLQPGETARVLGISTTWLRALVDRGALPVAARTRHGTMLFDPQVVEKFSRDREARRNRNNG